ncbi:hypothetical protein [Tardiphaga sp. 813_E8_N1_3]|uniref:hypothetical protein n=1 Tax=Tardiphaga sp. 813_E8_N1_3 TaxID=3240760 RepID=UPI003F1F2371
MTTIEEHLEDLELLVRTAKSTGMKPDAFTTGFRDAMHKVSSSFKGAPPEGFLNADHFLTEALLSYEEHPNLAGIGRIGTALVGYQRSAIAMR